MRLRAACRRPLGYSSLVDRVRFELTAGRMSRGIKNPGPSTNLATDPWSMVAAASRPGFVVSMIGISLLGSPGAERPEALCRWCTLLESNQLPLAYQARPSPVGLTCVNGASFAAIEPAEGIDSRPRREKDLARRDAGLKFTNGRNPARPKKKFRCLKPPFAAPPKETGTGQRAVLCSRRDGHPERKLSSRHDAILRRLRIRRWRRSVDVVEIDLAGLGLGEPAARHNGPHDGARHRRGENLLIGSLRVGAGHVSLSALWQREIPAADLRSCYSAGPEIFGLCRIARTLLRHGHARPITRPNERQRGGGFRDDM